MFLFLVMNRFVFSYKICHFHHVTVELCRYWWVILPTTRWCWPYSDPPQQPAAFVGSRWLLSAPSASPPSLTDRRLSCCISLSPPAKSTFTFSISSLYDSARQTRICSYAQHLFAFPVFIAFVGLLARRFQPAVDDGIEHCVWCTWASCLQCRKQTVCLYGGHGKAYMGYWTNMNLPGADASGLADKGPVADSEPGLLFTWDTKRVGVKRHKTVDRQPDRQQSHVNKL